MDLSQMDENHGEADSTDSELVNLKKPDRSSSYPNEDSLFLVSNDELAVNEIQVDDQNIEYLIVGCDITTGDDITSIDKTVEELQNDNVLTSTSVPVNEVMLTPVESSSDVLPKDEISPTFKEKKTLHNVRIPSAKQKFKIVSQNINNSNKWDAEMTKSLIEIRKEMDYLFKLKKDKNQSTVLWNNVVDQLMKRNPNCPVSLYECADKWRSLLMTYKINLAKYKKYGSSLVTWEYFHDIHDWMKNDNCSEFTRAMKSSSNHSKEINPKKKFRIEKTLEKVPSTMLENSIVIKSCELQSNDEPPPINRPIHNSFIQPLQESSADYHFAMLILRELESLPPSIKDKKKQKMLLALYD